MGSVAGTDRYGTEPCFTEHAAFRMNSRHVSTTDIAVVMSYGRSIHVRGALIYALGHREAAICRQDGIKVDRVEGLQVVCAAKDNTVITVYRNNDLRSLRRRNNRWSPRFLTGIPDNRY